MKPILFTGDSHLAAIRKSLDPTVAEKLPGFVDFAPLGRGGEAVTDFFSVLDCGLSVTTHGDGWRNRTFSRETVQINGQEAVLVLSMPLNTSRILRDYSWARNVPWSFKSKNIEIALSDTLLHELISYDSGNSIRFAVALQNAGVDVVILEGPRFFENADYLESCRFEVCQYVDEAYRRYVGRVLSENGLEIIAQPPQTITDYGTTNLEYDHPDPSDNHHANVAYGGLVLEHVIEFAKSSR